MKKYFEILRNCPLFDGIDGENLSAMLGCLGATVRRYEKKEVIFAEGDAAQYIGIVLSGAVQVVRVDYFGNRTIVAGIAPNELFGETFACAEVESIPVDVVASEDCEVLLIDCRRIVSSCSNACAFHFQMVYNLMRVVARKNLVFHQKIEITSARTTREKLIAYLLSEAKKRGSAEFEIPYDRQELADYLEVERSGLSAEISKLRREGILKAERNRFTILGLN